MTTLLDLSVELPDVALAAGEVLCAQDQPAGNLWVLVSGSLRVEKNGVIVGLIDQPGAVIGEISLLLDVPASASVIAATPSIVRHTPDGPTFLAAHPEALRFIATALASRLQASTTYLADLTEQYGDAPGLSMVGTVLKQLTAQQLPAARPGSARDPDPEY
jgi:CRP/FNR family transcriptional regulator, cyclic AMP receptor protein